MTKLQRSKGIWWFFAALTVFVYLYALNVPLLGPDEPRYAQVAREMWQAGDWVTPTLGGHNWFEKPALLYWLQITFYHVFGVTEFAARLGSALFGLGTIFCLWLVGRYATINDPRSTDDLASWLALVGASSCGLLVFARGASFDIIVTFPLAASLTGFFVYLKTQDCDSRCGTVGLAAFYFFAGLAMLAKGLIGVVFPFTIVGFYFVLSRQFPPKRFLVSILWGSVLMLAVAALWNVPMYLRHGWEFIDEFYIQHHFQRYTSNKYKHPQPFYFFWWVLPLMTLAWLPFFFGGSWRAVKLIFRFKKEDPLIRAPKIVEPDSTNMVDSPLHPNSSTPLLLFGLAWMLVPLVFFSISGSKLPGYILPALPGALILAAVFIYDFVQQSDARKRAVMATSLVTFLVVIGLLTFVVPKFADSDSVRRLIQTADANGYSTSRIANFATLSHNAEFYASGRLIRNADGSQVRFNDPAKLIEEQQKAGAPLLVLVPLKQIDRLKVENKTRIADNGDLAIFVINGN